MEGDNKGKQGETSEATSDQRTTLEQAIRNGWLLQDVRGMSVEVPVDFLLGLYDSFVSPEDAMYQIGAAWGRVFGRKLQQEAEHYSGSLQQVPMEELLLLLQDELVRGKWGRIVLDASRYAPKGLVLATIMAGPMTELPDNVSHGLVVLLSGFLAGVLGQLTGLPMAGLGKRFEEDRVVFAEIVVGHADRVSRVRASLSRDASWTDALSARAG